MRQSVCVLWMLAVMLSLSACASTALENPRAEVSSVPQNSEPSNEQETQSEELPENESRILVAYFSWADNAEQGNIDAMTSASVTVPGNIAQLASWIAEDVMADVFSIRVSEPYPADWDSCLDRANQEKADDARPELLENVENIGDYDTVFLGYPNWWYSCPMAILSFIESNDLSGKQVYLFCSHGTGGLARSVQDITAALPDSRISDHVFDVYEGNTADSRADLQVWLKAIGY